MDAIDQASLDRAFARLDARAGHKLTCPRCRHTDSVPSDPQKSRFTCDQCGCKIAFGSEQPDVTVNPHADRRFIEARFVTGRGDGQKDVTIALERQYAAQIAMEILSVCDPGTWQALSAGMQPPRAPASAGAMPRQPAPVPPPEAPAEAHGDARCACGAPSRFANGACQRCMQASLAGR